MQGSSGYVYCGIAYVSLSRIVSGSKQVLYVSGSVIRKWVYYVMSSYNVVGLVGSCLL